MLRPRSVNFRQHFRNLSLKTVPLSIFFIGINFNILKLKKFYVLHCSHKKKILKSYEENIFEDGFDEFCFPLKFKVVRFPVRIQHLK
jgi:hypothetical protein